MKSLGITHEVLVSVPLVKILDLERIFSTRCFDYILVHNKGQLLPTDSQ